MSDASWYTLKSIVSWKVLEKRIFESWKTLEFGLCKSWKVLVKSILMSVRTLVSAVFIKAYLGRIFIPQKEVFPQKIKGCNLEVFTCCV